MACPRSPGRRRDFFFADPAAAQVFRLGSWDGTLEGTTSFSRSTTEGGGVTSKTDNQHADERLTIRNSGMYLYDPRLATLTLGGTFGLFRDKLTFDGDTSRSDGTLLGYEAFASLLADQPLSLNLFANRNESSQSGGLVGLTKLVTENRGGTLFVRRLYIPSTFSYREEFQDEETRVRGAVARRKDDRRTVTYLGQRGWEDSEMELRYEFVDDSNRVFPKLSFQSHDGHLSYSLDFGEELNRRWDSRLRYYTRAGLADTTIWSADESLRIDHSDRLRSTYRYLFLRTESLDIVNATHTGIATLQHRLYESLTTTAGLDGSRQTLPQGEKDTARGRLDLAYTKRIPLDGRLNIGLGGSLQYEDDRFKAAETSVSQETHTAGSPFALPIALNNTLVVAASIVVTKTAFGPLPPGCILPPGPPTPLVLGTDYTVRTTNDITEIVPIPCAGATVGINPGDTIAVDYRFTVAPSLTFATTTWHANLSVDFRWIRVFLAHVQSDQELIAGRDGRFLDDTRTDSAGAELRYDGARVRVSLVGEVLRYRSSRLSYDSLRTRAVADFSILTGLALRLSADQVVTEFTDQQRKSTSQAARAALTYALNANLFVDLCGGVRRLEDTTQPTEQVTEGRLAVRWLYRKIEISPTFHFFDRQRGDTTTREYQAIVRTIRRF